MGNSPDPETKNVSRTITRWLGLIFSLGLIWLGTNTGLQAQGGTPSPADKLSFRLQLLTQPAMAAQGTGTQARLLSLPASGPGSLLRNEAGEILVYIRLADLTPVNAQALATAGATIINLAPTYNTVTAFVRVDRLAAVAAVPAVVSIQEELTPQISAEVIRPERVDPTAPARPQAQVDCGPATTSEGDIQLNAAAARAIFGLDGSGVTVGVLSDSYDNPAIVLGTDAAADIAAGDLPGPGNPCGRIAPVNVLQEGLARQDEGRAMLHIVHDLAPGANLAFASAFFGQFDFADQIRALRQQAGAEVIVDDVFYFDDPYFQDGPISQGIKDAVAAGVLYFTLAGNHHKAIAGHAVGSYEAPAYRPMACPAGLSLPGDCHDFDPTAAVDNRSGFTLAGGGRLDLNFQWAEPWYGVQTDLNIYLVDEANQILALSVNDNGVTQTPHEFFSYTNQTSLDQTVYLVINRAGGTAAPRLKYILLQVTGGLLAVERNTSAGGDIVGPTVYGHSGAKEAISLAAIRYDTNDTPEAFTSRGFPTYYYGPVIGTIPAAPLPAPETRLKPDVSATNGGRNTFFGSFTGAFYRFFGTSAAGPHAAAVAALMKQRANQLSLTLDQATAESILETTASLMAFSSPESSGAGLVNALAAVGAVGGDIGTPLILAFDGPAAVVAGQVFTVEVTARNVPTPGLYGAQFEIDYDPGLMSVITGSLQLNPALSLDLIREVDNDNGQTTLVASRQGHVPGLSGDVTLLAFEVMAGPQDGMAATFTFANQKLGDAQAQALAIQDESYTVTIAESPTPTPTPTSPLPSSEPESATPTPDTPTPTPETATPTHIPPETPSPTSTPTPASTPTQTPTPTPTPLSLTPTPGTPPATSESAILFGQVILSGRTAGDWAGANVTIVDTAQSVTTDDGGNFSLAGVSGGRHTALSADAPGYLSALCPAPTLTAPETGLLAVTLLSGDVNDDNTIDVTDATAIGLGFGQTGPNLPTDLNRDGLIDIFDIILTGVNFGQTGPQIWVCQ